MKTKLQIQNEALQSLKNHNYTGTIVMSTGTGKSKVAIDCIKAGNFKNVLISSPRENLKSNWEKELEKWGFKEDENESGKFYYLVTPVGVAYWAKVNITIENIQTCYKWEPRLIGTFDLIIVDEIHTIGPQYSAYIGLAIKNNIPVIGLTATPFKEDPFKTNILYTVVPIVYEYHKSEEDHITNNVKYYVLEYELTDNYKVLVQTKKNSWYQGEKSRYDYLTQKYEDAKKGMYDMGATDYFETSLFWMKFGNAAQKKAGSKFFYAIDNRKRFLWNLTSSAVKAVALKNLILREPNNKVLLFSELTPQADRLSLNAIHSNNGDTAKKIRENNIQLLENFNKGEIRELSSCLSLTLGLNMSGANWAIFESYSSSRVNSMQKKGRDLPIIL